MAAPVDRVPEPARHVLVLAPAVSTARSETCLALAARGEAVLLVRYSRADPDVWRNDWATHRGSEPPPVSVVGVGEDVEPDDLTGLAIAIADELAADTAVCFDSLTALLQYAEADGAYRFLHDLVGRVSHADASLHLHLDPSAAAEETVASLSTLVDAVVRPDDVQVRPGLTTGD